MRTLIGMIHYNTEHNKQLRSHYGARLRSSAAVTEHSCFSSPVQVLKVERGYEDVRVVPSHGPAKLGPLFPGSTPPHKPLPDELCHAPLSLVCRRGTRGIIHSI